MKNKILIVCLLLLVAFNVYEFVENFVYPRTFANPESVSFDSKRELQNPILQIFTGTVEYEEGKSVTVISVYHRFQLLIRLILVVGFLFSTYQFFATKGKKIRSLSFFLITQIWISFSLLVFYAVKLFYVKFAPSVIEVNEKFEFWSESAIAIVTIAIATLVLKGALEHNSSPAEDWHPAPSGVRYFHLVFDRFVLLFFAVNPFLVRWVYAEMAGSANYPGEENLELLAIVSFSISSLLAYLYTEWMFGFSPSKVITSSVVRTVSGHKIGFLKTTGRTLMRFVPLDNFSFLFGQGWHDRASDTTVITKMKRDSFGKLTAGVLIGFIIILTWANSGGVQLLMEELDIIRINSISPWSYHYQLPLLMVAIFLVPLALLVSCWFGIEKSNAEVKMGRQDRGIDNLILLCWFIPFANFFVPKRSIRNLNDDLSGDDYSEAADRLYAGGRTFAILFHVSYFFFILACIAMVDRLRSGLIIAGIFFELFLILFYIGFAVYRRRITSYLNYQNEKNSSIPDSAVS